MKTIDLKKLAQISIEDGKIDATISKVALGYLSKSQLRQYLFFLKKEIASKKIKVYVAQTLSEAEQKNIKEKFKDKTIEYEVKKDIGAGIVIVDNDNIIDASLKGYIAQTINLLKD